MSKPLAFVLQFVGFFFIVKGAIGALPGAPEAAENLPLLLIGIVCVLAGGIGVRRRLKNQ